LYSTTSADNTGVGADALYSSTGAGNTAVGFQAGYTATAGNANTTGTNNTWVGYNSGPGTTTQYSNSSALGYAALNTASNQVMLGNSSVTQVKTSGDLKGGNTVLLTSDIGSITGTTAGGSTTVFTLPALQASTSYSVHCSGTTTQATAGGGIGIAVTFGTNAPTNAELHASVATSLTAMNAGATQLTSGNVTSTTATIVYASTSGTVTTQLPFYIDGSIEVGSTAPASIIIGFYSASGSDAVTVKRDSYCTVMP
jgi:hypothetical protein